MFGRQRRQTANGESPVVRDGERSASGHSAQDPPRGARSAQPRSRRGILLLVVLSMLVLFLMIGTAFIVVAKQSEKAAKSSVKTALSDSNEVARGDLLDDALLQIIRDTDNPLSVLRGHSLLGDLYGNDGFRSQITLGTVNWAAAQTAVGTNPTNGQLINFTVAGAVDMYRRPMALSNLDGAYNGQVLTFVRDAASLPNPALVRGVSTRIVDFKLIGVNQWRFTVMTFAQADGQLLFDPTRIGDAEFIVNGRPFNGTGAGYNPYAAPDGPKLNARESIPGLTPTADDMPPYTNPVSPPPLVLLPNPVYRDYTRVRLPSPLTPPNFAYFPVNPTLPNAIEDWNGRGGADESYDAPDFQNMLLALLPQDDVQHNDPDDVQNPGASLDQLVLPSMHRPELVNFWMNQLQTAGQNLATNAMMLRKVVLRPNHLDHPDFTGSNGDYADRLLAFQQNNNATTQAAMMSAYIFGPWDVDNDNDGRRDSVWVDVGLPVVMGRHGKLVKPLAAILCVDLDGRVNINTAGTLDTAGAINNNSLNEYPILANGRETDDTPRGIGWGPADITVRGALGDQSFRGLVQGAMNPGDTDVDVPGKYGVNGVPGLGIGANGGMFDMMSQIRLFGWPRWGIERGTNFALPPDLRARYGAGVNDYGQLVVEALFPSERPGGLGQLIADSPYEMNLYAEGSDTNNSPPVLNVLNPSGHDAPFSLGELEQVLRVYDTDSTMQPDRISILADGIEPAERNRITVASWSVPGPTVSLPHEMETLRIQPNDPLVATDPTLLRLPRATAELFEMRIRKALNLPTWPVPFNDDINNPDSNNAKVRRIMRQLLAPELAAGMRLNVNRALGNGRDDDGDGVVDEPSSGIDADGDNNLDDVAEDGVANRRQLWPQRNANNDPLFSPATEPLDPNFSRFDSVFFPLDVTWDSDPNPGELDDDHPNPGNGPRLLGDSSLQRQLLARHIYTLGLTLTAEADFQPLAAGSAVAKPADAAMARRLAQWAINAVDFRDADSTMTPFEFDLNPFDGWAPDGDPRTTADIAGPDGIVGNQDDTGGLVWGAERPELVITETIAWHDRNTTNEADEDPNPGDEPADASDPLSEPGGERDQKYRPRGAFFLELYNPWPANPLATNELHRVENGIDYGVDLARTTGPDNNCPVWRLVVYRDVDPSKDPDDPNNLPTGIDRSIYFTSFDPQYGVSNNEPGRQTIPPAPNWQPDGVAFYNDFRDQFTRNINPVRPGRYMVIGSGTETAPGVYFANLGQRLDQVPSDRPRKPLRGIEMRLQNSPPIRLVDNARGEDSTAWQRTVAGGGNNPGQDLYPMEPPSEQAVVAGGAPRVEALNPNNSITDVAVINAVTNPATGVTRTRRLTVSEPAIGYPDRPDFDGDGIPDGNTSWVPKENLPEGQFDPSEDGIYCWGGDPTRPMAVDTPLDNMGDGDLATLGTKLNYRRIYLQRLANPRAAYDPLLNPYRTVDSATVNLTVFSGRLLRTESEFVDPNDPNGAPQGSRNSSATGGFTSLERGYRDEDTDDDEQNLWSMQPLDSDRVLNLPERAAMTGQDDNYSLRSVPSATLGFLNRVYMDEPEDVNNSAMLRIKPDDPFPWLAWNDRPYVSGNEMMLVPRMSSSFMLRSFTMTSDDYQSPYDTASFYDPSADPREIPDEDDVPGFLHLENFFYDEEPGAGGGGGGGGGAGVSNQPSHLHRLLEYVETPSLFTGATTWLNPFMTSSTQPVIAPNPIDPGDDPRADRRPPFNNVSAFREPGRINLNTIFSEGVYRCLFNADAFNSGGGGGGGGGGGVEPDGSGNAHPGPRWAVGGGGGSADDSLVRSRRGYGQQGAPPDILLLDPQSPTFFANPFRSSGAGELVPLANMMRAGVECSLLRSTSATGGKNAQGQFNVDDNPLFAAETDDDHNDWERHAFFRYSPLTRLNNLVTTQSNVYAVWITVGFFEVEEIPDNHAVFQNFPDNVADVATAAADPTSPFNRVYPDGYMFGKEDGLDEGNVRRLRGFYVIDRSLPVGFEPGVDHNVEDTIRLRRRIE